MVAHRIPFHQRLRAPETDLLIPPLHQAGIRRAEEHEAQIRRIQLNRQVSLGAFRHPILHPSGLFSRVNTNPRAFNGSHNVSSSPSIE